MKRPWCPRSPGAVAKLGRAARRRVGPAGQPGDTADDPGDRDRVRGSGLARPHGRPRPARPERGEPGHHRRDRNRQGAGRPLHPREQHAQGRTLRRGQLRRAGRQPGRGRAVRIREGRLHRGAQGPGRLVRGGEWRHAPPRRDRRPAGTAPGQAAPRPAGARGRPPRRAQPGSGRRARPRRHQYRPRCGGRRRTVPAGPLLPAERRHHPAAAAPPTARRHPLACRAFPRALSHAHEPAGPRPRRGGTGRARSPIRGRATSANWRT